MTHVTEHGLVNIAHAKACVTWWTLAGETKQETMATIVQELALTGIKAPPLPSISVETAMRRALRTFESKSVLIRSGGRGNDGHAIVRESWVKGRPVYDVIAKVRAVEHEDEIDVDWDGAEDGEICFDVLECAFTRSLRYYATEDVSSWTLTFAQQFQAARVRETGGIYYIADQFGDAWRRVRAELNKRTAHTIYELPVATSESAIEAVVAALEHEVAAALEHAERIADERGPRAINTQRTLLANLSNRIRFFEGAFGRGLETITDRIERVDAACVAAVIRAESDNG